MYKRGQGVASRTGVAVIGVLLALYAAISWYRQFMPLDARTTAEHILSLGFLGGLVVFFGVGVMALYVSFFHPRAGEFLIEMDLELRKVVWPSTTPLFDPKAEAWGSTYVVIVCTVMFTIFIWLADLFLHYGITELLFRRILFASS